MVAARVGMRGKGELWFNGFKVSVMKMSKF